MSSLETGDGGYRFRRGGDAVWPPVGRAYGGQVESAWPKVVQSLRVVGRLAMPVSLTVILLYASYLYADDFLPMAGMPRAVRGASLAISDLVLPCAWLSIQLTNRRYGPAYAFAQLLAAMSLALLAVVINPAGMEAWIGTLPALTSRAALSFGFAFVLANFAGITLFDGARGPRWWTAPLAGFFAAALVFSFVYYPSAFLGLYDHWADAALVHLAAFFAVSVGLLLPYWLLRPAMRPLDGRNGY